MAINPTEFANVQLTDDFNTWRTRTNKTLAAFSTNTFTTSNTVHSNGTPKAITFGHGRLRGTLSANQLYANSYISGGEFGNPDTLTITTNNYTFGKLTVANNATIGLSGHDELLSTARLRATANALFRETVRMDANVFIGTANTDTLVVNAVSTFDGGVTFRDDVVVTANVDITGDSVNITGNTIIGSANTDTLAINATTDINAATNIDGNVTVTGKVTFNGNTVIGNANTDTLTVGADTTFNGPVTLNGVTDVSGTMVFNGNTTLGNASTDKLIVPSHSVFQSNVTVGDAASDKLLVTGHAQFSSNLFVEGTTKLYGGTTIIGNATGDDVTFTARVASSFVPKTDGVHTLGTTGLRWEQLFADTVTAGNAALSGTLGVAGATTLDGAVTLGNATGDDLTFTGRAASSLVPKTDGVYTLGTTGLRWEQLFADTVTAGNAALSGTFNVEGATTLDGAVTLGDATGDDLTFTGRAASSLVPKTDGAVDLGTSALRWRQVYADDITTRNAALTGTLDVDGVSTFNGNVVLGNAITDTVTINGASDLTGTLDVDGATTITGTTIVNGSVDLGSSTSHTITTTGRFDGPLVPSTTGTRDLGTASLEWRNLYLTGTAKVDELLVDENVTVTGNTTLNGNVILGNANTDTVTINGASELNGTTIVDGVMTVTGTATVNGNTTIGTANTDTLTVESGSTFKATSEFEGNVTIQGKAQLNGNTTIDGALSLGSGFTLSATEGIYDRLRVDNHTTLGSSNTDIVRFRATVNSSIIPTVTGIKDLGSSGKQWRNLYIDGTAEIDTLSLNGTTVTSTAAEINKLDGFTGVAADLNYAKDLKATGVTATEFNTALDGITVSAAELNLLDDVTGLAKADFTKLAAIDASAAELNILDGVTATTAELNIMDGVTATTAELNIMDGVTSTTAELNKIDGYTGTHTELNYAKDLYDTGVTSTEFNTALDGITATAAELNTMAGITSTTAELNILDGVTSTAAELNKLDGYTGTHTELNYAKELYDTDVTATEFNTLDGITATTAELNKLDGFTGVAADLNYAKDLKATGVTSTEFDYLDGVTSNIQTQLGTKLNLAGGTLTGTLTSRSITPSTADSYDVGESGNKFRNYYASGEFFGTATNAKFADLAEKYVADADYDEGTVIVVGGEAEVTASSPETAHSVIGVVSTNPAFKMNSELEGGTYIALKGRVPVQISGSVSKGDRLVASNNGKAIKAADGCGEISFAIALEDGADGTIEAVIL
jgi:hypothetical protein